MMVKLIEILRDRTYTEAGYELFNIADKSISSNDIIVIDMEQVTSIPTLLMNTSFGDLIDKYGIETTKKAFRFNNISGPQIQRIRKYFEDYSKIM